MYFAFIISILSVISVVSILISIERRNKSELSMELFSFKFKYVGVILVIISIIISFFELMEVQLYNSIRIIIANSGLIIIALSKDRIEFKERNFVKMACFSLSTFVFYLGNHLMIIFFGAEKEVALEKFVLYLLLAYLISYHYFKYKFTNGA